MKEKKEKLLSLDRLLWEIHRAFYSFWTGPLMAVILMQVAALLFMWAKGAGRFYLGILPLLLLITICSWLCISMVHGNRKILIYTLVLLTAGIMLQCIFIEEMAIRGGEDMATASMISLKIQYLVSLVISVIAGGFYFRWDLIPKKRTTAVMAAFALVLSMVTLFFSEGVGGVKNWISLAGISVQTTEISKFIYIPVSAFLLCRVEEAGKKRLPFFYGYTLLTLLLLAFQGEFGTLLLLLLVFLSLHLLFVEDLRYFLAVLASLLVSGGIMTAVGRRLTAMQMDGSGAGLGQLARIYLSGYSKICNRFIYWLNPEKDPAGLGYQLLKAKESIWLGGFFGTSSVTDLPVKSSDLVYPALIQRCGLLFALLIFIVFILLWLEGMKVFIRKKDRYQQVIAAGFAAMIFYQALIIIAGSTGMCPLTGITLPFISSGGSSLVICSAMTAVLAAVSGNITWKGGKNS